MSNDSQLLDKAQKAMNNGNIVGSRAIVKKIKNYKKNAQAINLLALCYAIQGEYSKSENLFKKTMGLTQPTDSLLTNLGLSQLHQRKTEEAIRSFLSAIELNPNNYDARSNISICYDYLNDTSNAYKHAYHSNKLKSNVPQVINILAKHAFFSNDIIKAIRLYQHSLSLHQNQPLIYIQLAHSYSIQKQYGEAEKTLTNAKNTYSNNPLLANALGHFFETRNRYYEAMIEYESVIQKQNDNTIAIAAKSRILISQKKFDSAYSFLLNAQNKYPNRPEIISEKCNYHILMKEYEKSYKTSKNYINSLSSKNTIPENIALSHSISCRHCNRLIESKEILEKTIKTGSTQSETKEALLTSLGDTLDKMKEYDLAFSYYSKANNVSPKPSDIIYYETILSGLSSNIDRAYLNDIPSSSNLSTTPVFIVGMPRSGTSLVEQIISSHSAAYGGGELTDLWSVGNSISGSMNLTNYIDNLSKVTKKELARYANTYLEKLSKISNGELCVTDKLPHNFMHIGLIERLLPNAKIIHCQRHPFDTCLSIYFKKFNDNHIYAKDLEELARFYKKYMVLMEHWNKVSCLAIHTTQYEYMVTNQEVESRKIINHINLNWSDNILEYYQSNRVIMTPSHHQASKPIYKDSMYRWKNYTRHIKPLIKVLGDPEKYV